MRKYTFSLKALRTIQISGFTLATLITLLSLIYLSSFKILMITIIAVCWIGAILSLCIILPIFFRRGVIYISNTEISLHSGVFFRRRQHMRASSVQYTSQTKFPLATLTSLNFIALHALGATVVLPFLSRSDSEEIITLINTRICE